MSSNLLISKTDLHQQILNNVYRKEIIQFKFINSTGKLPYLPDEIINHILQFFPSTTDYIDYYIEKLYNLNQNNFYLEILPYLIQLHNNPKKEEICKNWDYGREFLLISERHEDGKSFYSWNWDDSFCCDFLLQVKCISKPRNKIDNKQLLEYILPINKILRIDYKCAMDGRPIYWETDLGPHFQKIIDADTKTQDEIFNIWNEDYVRSFLLTLKNHETGKKNYFIGNQNATFMCSFVTTFMMFQYH
jgi:hypothetical protein